MSEKIFVIPPHRTRYLSEIAENNRKYDETALSQEQVAQKLYGIYKTIETVSNKKPELNKAGIDDASVLPSATAPHDENRIFFEFTFESIRQSKNGFRPLQLGNDSDLE